MYFSGQIKQNEIAFKILFLEIKQNLEGGIYSPIRTLKIKLFGKTIFKKINNTYKRY